MEFSLDEFAIFEKATQAMLVTLNRDGIVLKSNERWLDKLNISKKDFVKHSIFDFIQSEDIEKLQYAFKKIRDQPDYQGVIRFVDKNFTSYFFQLELKQVDQLIYLIGFDISERQKEHHALQEMSILTKTGAWYHDPLRDESYWSDEIYKIHDLEIGEPMNGKKALSFYSPEHLRKVVPLVDRLYNKHEPYDYTGEIITAKGTRKWIRTIAKPTVHDGKLIYINGVTIDRTKSKENADKIEQQSETHNLALKGIKSGLFDFDFLDKSVLLSAYFRKMLGLLNEAEKISDVEFMKLVHPEDIEAANDRLSEAVNAPGNHYYNQYRLRHANGSYNYYEIFGWRKKDKDGKTIRIIGNLIDINEKVLIQQEQVMTQNSLLAMINNGFISSFLMDTEGTILMGDQQALDSIKNEYGVNPREQKVRFVDVMPDVLKPTFLKEFAKTLKGETVRKEADRPLLDGAIQSLDVMYRPIRNEKEEIVFVLANFMDISERKRAEFSIIGAEEKVRSLDLLKSSILSSLSHEIRTPLNGIMGANELLLKKAKDLDQKALLVMQKESNLRLEKVLTEIIELGDVDAKKESVILSRFDVNGLLQKCFDMYNYQTKMKKLEFVFFPCKEDIDILVNQEIFIVAIGALINNAIKYTNQGKVEMTCGLDSLADQVVITICDTGVGVDQRDLDLIIQKLENKSIDMGKKYEGSGIGLAISSRFIELMNGKMTGKSSIGSGTVFKILIPAVV